MADLRPQHTEEVVGANHPTKADVANRAWNVEHDVDGTHGTMNSPTLVTPALGTPASGVLTNCNGLPPAGVVGTALVNSGALGTPASGVLTNCTGLPLATGLTPAATLISLEGLALVAGDLLYATAADTLINLAKGAANLKLFMNAAGAVPEWAGGINLVVTNRNIANAGAQNIIGFSFKPSLVIIISVINLEIGGLSIGAYNGSTNFVVYDYENQTAETYNSSATHFIYHHRNSGGSQYATAVGTSFDADGVTITWSTSGTAGFAQLLVIGFR